MYTSDAFCVELIVVAVSYVVSPKSEFIPRVIATPITLVPVTFGAEALITTVSWGSMVILYQLGSVSESVSFSVYALVDNGEMIMPANIIEKIAKNNLERSGYDDRVTLIHTDGGIGLPEHAPFDRILVVAAAPSVPDPLIEQLNLGGIMLIPVGGKGFFQELMMVEKDEEGGVSQRRWGGVAFVPLTGEYGH